jgi:hypothetical protein
MDPMAYISHNPESEYAKSRPDAKAKDNWWSHLQFDYELDGKIVSVTGMAVHGCYLDLNARTKGKLVSSYGHSTVNVYIPTDTFQHIYNGMVGASEFDQFCDGKEIVDHQQGLTSFLCQKGTKDTELQVVMYRPISVEYDNEQDEEDHQNDPVEYDRIIVPMPDLYNSAKAKPTRNLVGGVAFLRFGLGYMCDPGAHDPSDTLPTTLLPGVSVKIMGFHAMSEDGLRIKKIGYRNNNNSFVY